MVVDIRAHARIKGTDADMALDYSQVSLTEDGKITHIKEFLKRDDAFAYAEASERGAPDRDSSRVVESAPSGRNPRGLGDTDNIAPSGR